MKLRGHDAISKTLSLRIIDVPWRVGRKVPRNLYAMTNPNEGEDGDGVAFGQLDSSWIAEHVVELHNALVEGERVRVEGEDGDVGNGNREDGPW